MSRNQRVGDLITIAVVTAVSAAALWLAFYAGSRFYSILHEYEYYPFWVSLLLSSLAGVIAVIVVISIPVLVVGLLVACVDTPLGLLALAWGLVVLIAGVASTVMFPVAIPGVAGTPGFVIAAVCIVLGIIGAIISAAGAIEGVNGLSSGSSPGSSHQVHSTYDEQRFPRIKHHGKGFVILESQ